MYTEAIRQEILDKLIDIFKEDTYIEGVILVGSGANGFPDKWADIDLAVVVNPEEKTKDVWNKLNHKIKNTLNIMKSVYNEYGNNNFISVILLDNFLEIDMGVISISNLVAKKGNWEILFEKTNKISSKMKETWKNRKLPDLNEIVRLSQNSIWYHIKNAAFALKRERYYRVVKELEEIRSEIIKIKAAHENKVAKHFRDVDEMNSNFIAKLDKTFFSEVNTLSLEIAFLNLFNLYFDVIKEIFPNDKDIIGYEKRMRNFLTEIEITYSLRE